MYGSRESSTLTEVLMLALWLAKVDPPHSVSIISYFFSLAKGTKNQKIVSIKNYQYVDS